MDISLWLARATGSIAEYCGPDCAAQPRATPAPPPVPPLSMDCDDPGRFENAPLEKPLLPFDGDEEETDDDDDGDAAAVGGRRRRGTLFFRRLLGLAMDPMPRRAGDLPEAGEADRGEAVESEEDEEEAAVAAAWEEEEDREEGE